MITRKNFLRLMLIGFYFAITTTLIAQPGPRMGYMRQTDQFNQKRPFMFYGIERITEQIPDLTEDQKAKIKDFSNDFLKEINTLRADLAIKKAELRKLELAEQPDQNSINKKIDEIGELKTKIEKKRSEFHQKVRSILTKDQKVYFDTYCMRQGFRGQNYYRFRNPY